MVQRSEHLDVKLDLTFDWSYQSSRADLRSLYRKATGAQWHGERDLDWSIDVDLERESMPEMMHPLFGSDIYARLTPQEHTRLRCELTAWMQSQFLHGEQGALLAAAQLVDTVPDIDSKLYAATQVVDEGRHVEVFDRYLHQKVGFSYEIEDVATHRGDVARSAASRCERVVRRSARPARHDKPARVGAVRDETRALGLRGDAQSIAAVDELAGDRRGEATREARRHAGEERRREGRR
jgi:hypothetical protein